jgi:hypothetical protein
MAFSIQITDTRIDRDACGELAVYGAIQIGSFREELFISLEVWAQADYRRQWEAGLRRILSADRSCLITSMRDLAVSDFIDRWVLYRLGDEVVFQNQLLVTTEAPRGITESTIYDLVPPRETHTDDGQQISEWKVPLHDIYEFVVRSGEIGDTGFDPAR